MKNIASLICFLLLSFSLLAQDGGDIFGVWITQDNDCKVTFARDTNGELFGEILWIEAIHSNSDGPLLDVNNPDKRLRSQPIMGLRILNGFEYDQSKNKWVNGTVYDTTTGKTYKCQMWVQDDPNKLTLKGYIGVPLLGREVVWFRELAD